MCVCVINLLFSTVFEKRQICAIAHTQEKYIFILLWFIIHCCCCRCCCSCARAAVVAACVCVSLSKSAQFALCLANESYESADLNVTVSSLLVPFIGMFFFPYMSTSRFNESSITAKPCNVTRIAFNASNSLG